MESQGLKGYSKVEAIFTSKNIEAHASSIVLMTALFHSHVLTRCQKCSLPKMCHFRLNDKHKDAITFQPGEEESCCVLSNQLIKDGKMNLMPAQRDGITLCVFGCDSRTFTDQASLAAHSLTHCLTAPDEARKFGITA